MIKSITGLRVCTGVISDSVLACDCAFVIIDPFFHNSKQALEECFKSPCDHKYSNRRMSLGRSQKHLYGWAPSIT